MTYKIENIGSSFKDQGIDNLEKRINQYAENGYKFHTTFEISQPGCLGIGRPTNTILAVYVKED